MRRAWLPGVGSKEVSGGGVQVTFGFEAEFGLLSFSLCVVINTFGIGG